MDKELKVLERELEGAADCIQHISDPKLRLLYAGIAYRPWHVLQLGLKLLDAAPDRLAVLEPMLASIPPILDHIAEDDSAPFSVYDNHTAGDFEDLRRKIEHEIAAARARGETSDVYATYLRKRATAARP